MWLRGREAHADRGVGAAAGRIPVFILALLLAACAPVDGSAAAAAAVDAFHRRYNAGEFEQLYREASPAFRETAPEHEFEAFLGEVRTRLGAVRSSAQTASTLFAGTPSPQLMLTYTTQFERGVAEEQFVYQLRGEEAILVGYTLDAPSPIEAR